MRALYATGFFRNVELRRDGSTLVVVVQRAPVDRELRDQGQQGHQDRGAHQVAAQRGPGRRQDLRPRRCSRRSRAISPTSTSAAASTACRSTPRSRSSPTTACASLIDIKEGDARPHPPDQHRRQHQVQGKGHPRDLRAEDAEVELLVQAERPLFARIAAGRPGEAQVLLPGPRLRQLRHRVRAGDHLAREGRHVHHGQRQAKARSTRSPTPRSPATPSCR